jgi:MFS family permease
MRRDVSVMAIIGVAHACSHFLQLAMPAVFLAIRRDWDISFTSLGMAATVFYVTSGICQTLAGFAVDRFGARRMLYLGLGFFSGAVALMASLSPSVDSSGSPPTSATTSAPTSPSRLPIATASVSRSSVPARRRSRWPTTCCRWATRS